MISRGALGWPYSFSWYAFLVMGFVTGVMIPFCYAPHHIAAIPGGAALVEIPLVKVLTADRSGASLACLTIAFLALARYFLFREKRRQQARFLVHWQDSLRGAPGDLQGLSEALPATDPVGLYLRSARERWQGGQQDEGSLELLHRRLMREDLRLRQLTTPLVVLGLLGTLLGVFIGFLLTFSAGQGLELNVALRQAIVVVATACLSSVWGIGLGQLLVGPLADHLGRRTNEVFDHALALDHQLDARS